MGGGKSCRRLGGWGALVLLFCGVWGAPLHCEDISHRALFEQSSFDRWQTEGPREQISWRVQVFPARLSLNQRLEAGVEIHLPLKELAARRDHGRIVTLLQMTDAARHRFRTGQILELNGIESDATRGDVPFSWGVFVLPGEYQIAVALYDKVSGEHNFLETTLRVAPLANDPLPGLWRGLPPVEFNSPGQGMLDGILRTDRKSRVELPVVSKRPLHLEVLADVTPSEIFNGNPARYERYLGGVVRVVTLLSQARPNRGSVSVSALDLERRLVAAEQPNLDELDWSPWKDSLRSGNASLVPVRSLMDRRHSAVFLRDEIVRRLADAMDGPAPAGDPLVVFVIVGGPMDSYSFPDLPPVAASGTPNCAVFFLQYDFQGAMESHAAGGSARKLEKMLRPLHVQTFTVNSAESMRRALAAILSEIGQM